MYQAVDAIAVGDIVGDGDGTVAVSDSMISRLRLP